MPSSFESDYPAITRWIKESGRIEIGGASFADPFVKAVNIDGMLWGGKREYATIDEALKDMECGIDAVLVEQIWSLFRQIEAEQNEYEKIPWGVVRNVKSFDLIVVEHALKAVLRPYETSFWLYHAARDYTGRTDELIPRSAPLVEDIARFWRKYLRLKR